MQIEQDAIDALIARLEAREEKSFVDKFRRWAERDGHYLYKIRNLRKWRIFDSNGDLVITASFAALEEMFESCIHQQVPGSNLRANITCFASHRRAAFIGVSEDEVTQWLAQGYCLFQSEPQFHPDGSKMEALVKYAQDGLYNTLIAPSLLPLVTDFERHMLSGFESIDRLADVGVHVVLTDALVTENSRWWGLYREPLLELGRWVLRGLAKRKRSRGSVGRWRTILHAAQEGRCALCGSLRLPVGSDSHVDHVVPVSRGGTNDLDNLQLLCPHCNLVKHDRLMDEL